MKLLKSTLGLLTVSMLSACATGPAFQAPGPAPADQAQLYVYRTAKLIGSGNSHRVTIDGPREPLSLPNASWQRVLLAPGTHTVLVRDVFGTMTCGPAPLQIMLTAGQTAYVANVVGTTQGLNRLYIGCSVTERDETTALVELAGLYAAQ